MMSVITIIDYGAGNLASVRNAVRAIGGETVRATTPEDVMAAERIIFPGVGAAGRTLAGLRERGLDQALTETVCGRGRPMLAICVGMQVLATRLFEFGSHVGLGWISGEVRNLRELVGAQQRVPHMGWNLVDVNHGAEDLFSKVRGQRRFYFCHSFTLRDTDDDVIAATVEFGVPLVAAVRRDTFVGTQFHPEKSQANGRRFLESFLNWNP